MSSNFAYGVDLGWASQLEEQGWRWINEEGKREDILAIVKELGADSVRLRLFVSPPEDAYWQKRENERVMLGRCDTYSVMKMAERVKNAGMRFMLDIHYSDHFADPSFQDIPDAWKNCSASELCDKVHDYTVKVLSSMKERGIQPEWVQVGNEINNGMMWPAGRLSEHPEDLVRYLNAGYDGVKEVFQETKVVTHLAELNLPDENAGFFGNFFSHGGKTDILGFSMYKYWSEIFDHPYVKPVEDYLRIYHERYGKPVMIAEVGGDYKDPDGTYHLLVEGIRAAKAVSGEEGTGIFYWEPEAPGDVLSDAYPLGAAVLAGNAALAADGGENGSGAGSTDGSSAGTGSRLIKFTKALTAYRDERES